MTTTVEVAHSSNDIIIHRYDDNSILKSQANVLLQFLPNCVIYEPFPLNIPGKVQGAYTKIFTGIFENTKSLDDVLPQIYQGISDFINHLNKDGKTVSRIEGWIYQSDTKSHLPHTTNNPIGNMSMTSGCVYKSNWVFCDIFKEENYHKQTVFSNRFIREINDVEVTHKYWTLCIDSSWLSI